MAQTKVPFVPVVLNFLLLINHTVSRGEYLVLRNRKQQAGGKNWTMSFIICVFKILLQLLHHGRWDGPEQ
jgi:hypothetical protein